MLDQGRYTWRQDDILHYIGKILSENKKKKIRFYVDIPNLNINSGALPPNIIFSSQKSDIVIIDKSITSATVWLCKLTFPIDANINNANSYKKDKYESLKEDIIKNRYKCHLKPFLIDS